MILRRMALSERFELESLRALRLLPRCARSRSGQAENERGEAEQESRGPRRARFSRVGGESAEPALSEVEGRNPERSAARREVEGTTREMLGVLDIRNYNPSG